MQDDPASRLYLTHSAPDKVTRLGYWQANKKGAIIQPTKEAQCSPLETCSFRVSLQPRLTWNSLCHPGRPWTSQQASCLSLSQTPGVNAHFVYYLPVIGQMSPASLRGHWCCRPAPQLALGTVTAVVPFPLLLHSWAHGHILIFKANRPI